MCWNLLKLNHAIITHPHSHKIMHTHLHEIIHANTQAHNLSKVFNLPKIKHSTKVLIWSTKSEVLQRHHESGIDSGLEGGDRDLVRSHWRESRGTPKKKCL
jgi:hypothetical protein